MNGWSARTIIKNIVSPGTGATAGPGACTGRVAISGLEAGACADDEAILFPETTKSNNEIIIIGLCSYCHYFASC